ncbi:MAG: hypothetical protein KC912_12640 [Proteobacteria bacterium]|nr:hypothetical protein [Pseudomonadota bacterium]
MAESPDIPLPQDEDAGFAFRAQMAGYNFLMRFWREGIALVAIFLVAMLVFSFWQQKQTADQRGWTGETAEIESKLPDVVRFGLTSQNVSDEDKAATREVADRLTEVGKKASGVAAAEAWLKAAEYYRISGESTQRRAAIEAAVPHATGILRYSAEGGLANLDLEEGQGDSAVSRLRSLSTELDSFLAEQASFDLAVTLENLERKDEAVTAYDDFLTRFPESARTDDVSKRKARLAGEG